MMVTKPVFLARNPGSPFDYIRNNGLIPPKARKLVQDKRRPDNHSCPSTEVIQPGVEPVEVT